ncbi:hypothetical protein CEXT_96771, partial [Caerostris extrusa]
MGHQPFLWTLRTISFNILSGKQGLFLLSLVNGKTASSAVQTT